MQIGEIISKASTALNDADGDRWDSAELIEYLNSALLALSTLDPAAFETAGSLVLVAGPKQAIPTGATQLLDALRNTDGPAILPMSKSALDLHTPNWMADTQSATIENFAYDPNKESGHFYVYPPAIVGTSIDISYVARLTPVSDAMELLPVEDMYEPILLDYVLARAYIKNSGVAEAGKASALFQSFYTGLGFHVKVAEKMAAKAVEAA